MRLKQFLTAECGGTGELRMRISNSQVTLNGEPIREIPDVETEVTSLGDWLTQLPLETLQRILLVAKFYPIESLPECDLKISKEVFGDKAIIRISKKQVYIFTI